MNEIDQEYEFDICPECEQKTLKAKFSGTECVNSDCGYWFCFQIYGSKFKRKENELMGAPKATNLEDYAAATPATEESK